MTEAMPFLQKYDITFLRPPTIWRGAFHTAGRRLCSLLSEQRTAGWNASYRTSR